MKTAILYPEPTQYDTQQLRLRIVPRSQPDVGSVRHTETAADTVTHKLNVVYGDQASSLEQPFMSAQLGCLSRETW